MTGRWDAALFCELQSRIVVSLDSTSLLGLERICAEEKVPMVCLGHVGGDTFVVPDQFNLGVDEISNAWNGGLIRYMRS